MEIIADLHMHSKYSRACSKDLDIKNMEKYARIKGVNLMGTGDFQHLKWQKELKEELIEDGTGILKTKTGFNFMLTSEISLIYSQGGSGRKVHNVIWAKNLDVAAHVSEELLRHGRIDYDGRPIFGMSCPEFVDVMKSVDKDIEIIPAHCLLPGTYIHSNPALKKIELFKKGDLVLTHKGNFKKVLGIYKRSYKGKIYQIIPWYFREGLATTSEHPFYAIKSFKNCSWTKGICKPLCSEKKNCKKKHYAKYTPEWIPASSLEKDDFIVYPRLKKTKNIIRLKLSEFIDLPEKNLRKHINNIIITDKHFCRLSGYYLSEGYTIRDEAIGFSFNKSEKEYILDVIKLMEIVFNITFTKIDSRKGADIVFYSHTLNKFFTKLYYNGNEKRAWNKRLPEFMLSLPKEKQTEILRGWWRGDKGYTVSHELASQMKTLCIRLGIIPSLSKDSAEKFKARGKHFIGDREIKTNRDIFIFSNLSFFEKSELIKDLSFAKFVNKIDRKHGWIDKDFIYLPIREIQIKDYNGEVYNLEVEEDNSYVSEFAAVHNCWTPWFGVFGSNGGFDSIEEAFQEKTKEIHAIETGLSSDPAMNWRLSKLDKFSLISSSDSHSFWPWRLGRESTVFDLKELTYKKIIDALKTKDGLKETIEVDPAYGKYHYDGHRACNISYSPAESIKQKNICPVCKKPLTIGVEHRVEELADRPVGFKPENAVPFRKLIPLSDLISTSTGKAVATKSTWETYYKLVGKLGSEFDILTKTPGHELEKYVGKRLADFILKNRSQDIHVIPGYDGEYGIPVFDDSKIIEEPKPVIKNKQKGLSDFF